MTNAVLKFVQLKATKCWKVIRLIIGESLLAKMDNLNPELVKYLIIFNALLMHYN